MTTTSVSPTARSLWLGWRGVAAAGALVLLTALVLALAAGGGSTATLDPEGVDGNGSRALAQLLGRHGVTVVRARESDGRLITLLGTGSALRNDRLAEQGNASLTMNLLGAHERLVWDMPRLEDFPDAERQSAVDLLPSWVPVAVAQLFLAALLLALWRARRLGPVVDEPLPVAVRASEPT